MRRVTTQRLEEEGARGNTRKRQGRKRVGWVAETESLDERVSTQCCVCVRVCGHRNQQVGHQPGFVANPPCGQLDKGSDFSFLAVRGAENLVSRDGFECPVTRQSARSPYQG